MAQGKTLATLILLGLSITLAAQSQNQSQQRVEWNQPQKPFKVFGNTYWVGTRGLGSVLILVRRLRTERYRHERRDEEGGKRFSLSHKP